MLDNKNILPSEAQNEIYQNVRKDNAENETRILTPLGFSVSQEQLDKLFSKESTQGKTGAELAAVRATKIAVRKAHTAQIIAEMKATAVKRVYVSTGSVSLSGAMIEKIKPGDSVRISDYQNDIVDLLFDNKLFAQGKIFEENGYKQVKIIKLYQ